MILLSLIPQHGEENDSTTCQNVAMLGPLMVKQYNKLKVGTSHITETK